MTKRPGDKFEIVPFEKLKNSKAWHMTSEYIRKKECEGMGRGKMGRCYTCGAWKTYAELCAGHYREKRGASGIYFELDGIRPQCNYCNRRLHGNYGIYILKLVDEIGRERVDRLNMLAQKSRQFTKMELTEIEEKVGKLLEVL